MSTQFIDQLRQDLIDSGEASKTFMDYIDERIENAIKTRTCEIIGANEERLIEDLEDKFVTKVQLR